MKMILETKDARPHKNIDAAQCPGCPSNLATKLVMELVFQVCEERGQDPIIFGQGCGIGRDIMHRSASARTTAVLSACMPRWRCAALTARSS